MRLTSGAAVGNRYEGKGKKKMVTMQKARKGEAKIKISPETTNDTRPYRWDGSRRAYSREHGNSLAKLHDTDDDRPRHRRLPVGFSAYNFAKPKEKKER